MKIELDSSRRLKIDGVLRHCMYGKSRYCSGYCAQFSEPDIQKNKPSFPGDIRGDVYIYLCHDKTWFCKIEDFTDNRIKVSNA